MVLRNYLLAALVRCFLQQTSICKNSSDKNHRPQNDLKHVFYVNMGFMFTLMFAQISQLANLFFQLGRKECVACQYGTMTCHSHGLEDISLWNEISLKNRVDHTSADDIYISYLAPASNNLQLELFAWHHFLGVGEAFVHVAAGIPIWNETFWNAEYITPRKEPKKIPSNLRSYRKDLWSSTGAAPITMRDMLQPGLLARSWASLLNYFPPTMMADERFLPNSGAPFHWTMILGEVHPGTSTKCLRHSWRLWCTCSANFYNTSAKQVDYVFIYVYLCILGIPYANIYWVFELSGMVKKRLNHPGTHRMEPQTKEILEQVPLGAAQFLVPRCSKWLCAACFCT